MSVAGRAKSLVTDKQHRLHLRGEIVVNGLLVEADTPYGVGCLFI